MTVLSFSAYFAFLALIKSKFSKLYFLKVTSKLCYICSQKKLRLQLENCVSYGCFKFFCLFCIFSIEKIKILKIVYSKGYHKIMLCRVTKKFKVHIVPFYDYFLQKTKPQKILNKSNEKEQPNQSKLKAIQINLKQLCKNNYLIEFKFVLSTEPQSLFF